MFNVRKVILTTFTSTLLFTPVIVNSAITTITGTYVSLTLYTQTNFNSSSEPRLFKSSDLLEVPRGKKLIIRNVVCNSSLLGSAEALTSHDHLRAKVTVYGIHTRTQYFNNRPLAKSGTVPIISGWGSIGRVTNSMHYQAMMVLTENAKVKLETTIYGADEATDNMRADYYCSIQGNLYNM